MPRWMVAGGTAVAVATAATVGVAVGSRDGDSNTASATTPAVDLNVTPVARRDLARNEELDGTVGFGPESVLVLPLEGTLTSLPEEGTVIAHGSVIAAVDDEPVIAIRSDTTLWRDLGPTTGDGDDVLAIERMLAQLGYAADHDVTVDGDWTDATTSAVTAFQADHGQDGRRRDHPWRDRVDPRTAAHRRRRRRAWPAGERSRDHGHRSRGDRRRRPRRRRRHTAGRR